MGHGGHREGSGRKSKSEEAQLIERLSPMDDQALELLKEGLEKKDFQYLKLFMEYRFGKPKLPIQGDIDFNVLWNEQRTYEK